MQEIIEREQWGMSSNCPLNRLSSFHSVNGLPSDLLHDLFEGVIPEDLLSAIRVLSSKKWFSFAEYNNRLKSMGWKSYKAYDKPESLVDSKNTKKRRGKACSQWVHMRNFPLIVEPFIRDRNDPVLMLALKLHDLTERITAPEFYSYEIELFGDIVIEYLDVRKKIRSLYPDLFHRPKPKHHFLRY